MSRPVHRCESLTSRSTRFWVLAARRPQADALAQQAAGTLPFLSQLYTRRMVVCQRNLPALNPTASNLRDLTC